MKTLQESLFDDKLIEKDITFGDIYKPVAVFYRDIQNVQAIGNMFVLSKLKNIKPLSSNELSLNGIVGYSDRIKLFNYLPYVLAKIAELPIEERFETAKQDGNYIPYEFAMEKMFKDCIRSNSTGLYFTMSKYNWDPELCIRKSTMNGMWQIVIKYEKK